MFSILVIATFITLDAVLPEVYQHEFTPVINKIEFLKEIKPPRIILIGGSNLIYGINSKEIEREFNMKVANASLWFGFGIKFFIDVVEPYIGSGDVVILCPEYAIINDASIQTINRKSRLWYRYLSNKKISGDNFKWFLEDKFLLNQIRINTFIKNALSMNLRKSYAIRGDIDYDLHYTDNGDMRDIWFPAKKKDLKPYYGAFMPKFDLNQKSFDYLNSFNNACKQKGASFFFSYPPMPAKEFLKNKNTINDLHDTLTNSLRVSILGTPEEYVFPEERFTDSISHLDIQGRDMRTRKLISDLKEARNL